MLNLQDIEATLDKTKMDADLFLTSAKPHSERMVIGFRLLAKLAAVETAIRDKMSLDADNERYLKG